MKKSCRRCRWPIANQVFQDGRYEYDIGKALAILKVRPRNAVVLPALGTFNGVSSCEVNQTHVAHVDIRRPVIAVSIGRRNVIIDGNHRAWRRLFKRLPIRAYLLTNEERNVIRERKA